MIVTGCYIVDGMTLIIDGYAGQVVWEQAVVPDPGFSVPNGLLI